MSIAYVVQFVALDIGVSLDLLALSRPGSFARRAYGVTNVGPVSAIPKAFCHTPQSNCG